MTSSPAWRIAFFMADLSGGGVERMRLRLIQALLDQGHDVTLIVQSAAGPLGCLLPPALPVVDLHQAHARGCILPLAAWLRRVRPDFLVSSLHHNNIVAIAARALAAAGTRVIVCQHNALSMETGFGLKYRLLPLIYRALMPWADGIVCVSQGVADDFKCAVGVEADRLSIIHNPVFGDDLPGRARIALADAWLGASPAPVFVFAGRLVAQKDPLLLIEAFALFLRTRRARLIILGDGPMRGALERRVQELGIGAHVRFMGFVDDALPWIARANACVVTSRYEGFCNVIVEALACGTPVIATDCRHGPSEILADGVFGRLVPVGNVASLALAFGENLGARFPASVLRRRAALFSVTACARRHEALFASLGEPRRRTAWGLSFSRQTAADIACEIGCCERPEHVRLLITPNLDHIRLMRRAEFAQACRFAEILCGDGFPVALYAWLRGAGPARRLTGCDIFHHLASRAMQDGRRVLVIVESSHTEAALRGWLSARALEALWRIEVAAPRLEGNEQAQLRLVAAARSFMPDILVLTLGAPTSEEFAYRHRHVLPPAWVICVGQAVRIELGLVRRAPRAVRHCGLEWAWRVVQEPARLLPRYARALAWFPVAIAADLLRHGRRPPDPAAFY